jgi:hypothetical protein
VCPFPYSDISRHYMDCLPVPVAARSKAQVCGCSPAEIVPSNPAESTDVCLLSGRGFCDELNTRPDESYRIRCVVVCDLETSRLRRPWPALGRSAIKKCRLLRLCSAEWRTASQNRLLTEYFTNKKRGLNAKLYASVIVGCSYKLCE